MVCLFVLMLEMFCVNGGGCVFCLMVVVVVGFLFMVVAGFLC